MRIKNENLDRISDSKTTPSKLFLMMEGVDTEPIYFKEYFLNKRNVEYLPFERSKNDLGWSNPSLLMNQLLLELNCELSTFTYAEFMPFLVRYLKNTNQFLDVSAFKREFNSCLSKKGALPSMSCSEQLIDAVFEELKTTSFLDLIYQGLNDVKRDFSNFVESYYDEDADEIALVVDRDRLSFTEEQYEKVIRDGKDNNISVYVTNPCFEFFLALHLSDMLNVDKNALRENLKTNNITFAHSELLKLDPEYKKENFDVNKYISQTETVVRHLRLYC